MHNFKEMYIEYIRQGIFRAFFKFCMVDKLRRKWRGVKEMKRFSVHFNVHKLKK
jgi:hypothetical protein